MCVCVCVCKEHVNFQSLCHLNELESNAFLQVTWVIPDLYPSFPILQILSVFAIKNGASQLYCPTILDFDRFKNLPIWVG